MPAEDTTFHRKEPATPHGGTRGSGVAGVHTALQGSRVRDSLRLATDRRPRTSCTDRIRQLDILYPADSTCEVDEGVRCAGDEEPRPFARKAVGAQLVIEAHHLRIQIGRAHV